MRVFALSDIHVDYDVNEKWIAGLSVADYQEDVLILAGDVTDSGSLLAWCLSTLARRFKQVLFVPGNHDLWVIRDDRKKNSFEKFEEVSAVAASSGASMQVFRAGRVTIIPLLSWYDYSFGERATSCGRSGWTIAPAAGRTESRNETSLRISRRSMKSTPASREKPSSRIRIFCRASSWFRAQAGFCVPSSAVRDWTSRYEACARAFTCTVIATSTARSRSTECPTSTMLSDIRAKC